MLVKRDAVDLAASLERLVGRGTAQLVFGVGVLGMALSTIIILMLINGFAIAEMLGLPNEGWPRRLGALLAGVSGAVGSFFFGTPQAEFWLVVPTSMFGMTLLPIAYWTFILMFNSKSLMGRQHADRRQEAGLERRDDGLGHDRHDPVSVGHFTRQIAIRRFFGAGGIHRARRGSASDAKG